MGSLALVTGCPPSSRNDIAHTLAPHPAPDAYNPTHLMHAPRPCRFPLQKEKESSGIPDVPGGANKLIEVEFASIEDRKLRGSLRDASYIEAQVTALQVRGGGRAKSSVGGERREEGRGGGGVGAPSGTPPTSRPWPLPCRGQVRQTGSARVRKQLESGKDRRCMLGEPS